MRYKATQKQIKAAREYAPRLYTLLLVIQKPFSQQGLFFLTDKAAVLKHHPDKRKAVGEQITEGDNDYFTCITKGFNFGHCLFLDGLYM